MFCAAVPPSPPVCRVPTSVTTGSTVILSCHDGDGSPPPTYNWYKDGTLLPSEPNKIQAFKNYTYKLNPATGELVSFKLLPSLFTDSFDPHGLKHLKKRPLSLLLRHLPLCARWTPVSTTASLSTQLVPLRAVKP